MAFGKPPTNEYSSAVDQPLQCPSLYHHSLNMSHLMHDPDTLLATPLEGVRRDGSVHVGSDATERPAGCASSKHGIRGPTSPHTWGTANTYLAPNPWLPGATPSSATGWLANEALRGALYITVQQYKSWRGSALECATRGATELRRMREGPGRHLSDPAALTDSGGRCIHACLI